ncbi:16S rRNA pseudouridine(516) synthase [Paucibacter sp. R3-3]|uniref:Pseudouridine synthase n=1 Tax=Roseateles agri TaxID=3098619 RepID=A0ABU5DK41_9BURK|nr:16S rRNA pseudouridine(516) synthase [Paucibacter sp. R3-3]MDY0746657.1 16S rRNA pseudouridine(516) synthase [Paucibacter sp. R3-3]
MRLSQILFSQGFGTRRLCAGLIYNDEVKVGGELVDDPDAQFETDGLVFEVSGKTWPFFDKALILLNKPAGYECSQKPKHHPSVLSLLPGPLRERGVQPIGRLDEDTTGLLLLTDDGALIHKLTSPKHHVPKVYEATCKHPVTPEMVEKLKAGVELREPDDKPGYTEFTKAEGAEAFGTHGIRLTLIEGKYHQVKRMIAAIGNRCESLHRPSFGALQLPETLKSGEWTWVASPAEVSA